MTAARAAKQFLTFTGGTPLQPAVARGARAATTTTTPRWRDGLRAKRDRLCAGLAGRRARGAPPAGHLLREHRHPAARRADGVAFCWRLPERAGVVAIPTAVFHDDPDARPPFVRFAFCKRDEVIDEAARRLARLHVSAPRPQRPAKSPGRADRARARTGRAPARAPQ